MDSNSSKSQSIISMGDWLITLLITAIPLVNIIMLIFWAFGANVNVNKSNWAKATLIFFVVAIILYIVLFSAIMAMLTHVPYN